MRTILLTLALCILTTQLETGNIWIIIAELIVAATWALDIKKFFN